MPIYEFYCPPCHTVYSFFSARVDAAASPACPCCGRADLERKPSRFATLKHGADEEAGADPLAGVDDARLEAAMETLMADAENLGDDEDPRAMGRLMRRFSHLTGLDMGERMEDMITRLEAGEDPERLEAEIGDDDASLFEIKRALARRRKAPRIDDELYFL